MSRERLSETSLGNGCRRWYLICFPHHTVHGHGLLQGAKQRGADGVRLKVAGCLRTQ